MIRRLSGLALLIIGLAGVALSIAGMIYSGRAVDAVGETLTSTLTLTNDSLVTVEDSLVLARGTIDDVNISLVTVGETADSLAKTLEDTGPLLEDVTAVVATEAPQNLEAMQAAIPNMAEVAGVVDETLTTLSAFGGDYAIPNPLSSSTPLYEFEIDLGVDYAPAEPFDETVLTLGSALDGLPERLRGLEANLQTANDNLTVVSENIYAVGDDLVVINGRIAAAGPLLDEYTGIVQDLNATVTETQTLLDNQLDTARIALQIGLAWLGLMQFALLYLGYDLLTREED